MSRASKNILSYFQSIWGYIFFPDSKWLKLSIHLSKRARNLLAFDFHASFFRARSHWWSSAMPRLSILRPVSSTFLAAPAEGARAGAQSRTSTQLGPPRRCVWWISSVGGACFMGVGGNSGGPPQRFQEYHHVSVRRNGGDMSGVSLHAEDFLSFCLLGYGRLCWVLCALTLWRCEQPNNAVCILVNLHFLLRDIDLHYVGT